MKVYVYHNEAFKVRPPVNNSIIVEWMGYQVEIRAERSERFSVRFVDYDLLEGSVLRVNNAFDLACDRMVSRYNREHQRDLVNELEVFYEEL